MAGVFRFVQQYTTSKNFSQGLTKGTKPKLLDKTKFVALVDALCSLTPHALRLQYQSLL
jgi:hypothetical protein